MAGCTNLALGGTASASSEAWGGAAQRAIDGDANGAWGGGSCSHTQNGEAEWWQVDLGAVQVSDCSRSVWPPPKAVPYMYTAVCCDIYCLVADS
eukprot:SAG22_NODE_6729_length_818_cov_2.083449_1_plen_94_part_00